MGSVAIAQDPFGARADEDLSGLNCACILPRCYGAGMEPLFWVKEPGMTGTVVRYRADGVLYLLDLNLSYLEIFLGSLGVDDDALLADPEELSRVFPEGGGELAQAAHQLVVEGRSLLKTALESIENPTLVLASRLAEFLGRVASCVDLALRQSISACVCDECPGGSTGASCSYKTSAQEHLSSLIIKSRLVARRMGEKSAELVAALAAERRAFEQLRAASTDYFGKALLYGQRISEALPDGVMLPPPKRPDPTGPSFLDLLGAAVLGRG